MGGKLTGGDGRWDERLDLLKKFFVEVFGFGGRGCVVEAGAVAFLGVGKERELADDEETALGVEKAAVHGAGVIGKDAEVDDFLREFRAVAFGIVFLDSEEDEEAVADGGNLSVVNGDGGVGDSLKKGAHGRLEIRE